MIGFRSARGTWRTKQTVLAAVVAASLAGCGGGGSGGGAGEAAAPGESAPPVASVTGVPDTSGQQPLAGVQESTAGPDARSAPNAADSIDSGLRISEVSTSYYSNDVAWFEVYNPSSISVRLAEYSLRSSTIDIDTQSHSYSPSLFPLPDVVVPAKGYLVIAGKPVDQLQDSAQMVYLRKGSLVPFWNANGSLELMRGGMTIDFVRFGTSTAAPEVVDQWIGANVAALPSGPDEHGKSIVRLHANGMRDTNGAADWSLVNFATPAGMNDIGPGVIDSDLDGIPDSAKVSGGTYGGLDLYAMGARRGRRDIFLEIDYMDGSDVATTPRREAIEKMRDAFAARGIALHVDVGSLYAPGFAPAQFNLGGGNAVPFAPCIELDTLGDRDGPRAGCSSFQGYKNGNFDVRRRLVFHYALFANSLNTDGSAGPSGIAEMYGNDLIVTLGGYDLATATESGRNILINLQAGTLMHEFGHNLGLRHGGDEDANYKPNHYSVMNYMYQFAGLSNTPDSEHAAERYYLANGLKGKTFCGLTENSPCTSAYRIDYSDGRGGAIDERSLQESANIGRGAVAGAFADWDNDHKLTEARFARNINPLDGYSKGVLRDYDEWKNLWVSFARGYSGSSSGLSKQMKVARPNPMNELHPHHRVEETHLPPALRSAIRETCRARH
ncbi:MAG TPA: hypothetical protein VGE12_12290 [Noviherbaspirillum sp.]